MSEQVRCAICDEWYDIDGERAKIHEHPPPNRKAASRAISGTGSREMTLSK